MRTIPTMRQIRAKLSRLRCYREDLDQAISALESLTAKRPAIAKLLPAAQISTIMAIEHPRTWKGTAAAGAA